MVGDYVYIMSKSLGSDGAGTKHTGDVVDCHNTLLNTAIGDKWSDFDDEEDANGIGIFRLPKNT